MIDSLFKYVTGKVAIRGLTDNGSIKDVPVTQEGHLEVAIHGPTLPFKSIHTESLEAIFQEDAVYGIHSRDIRKTEVGSATISASDSSFVLQTGATVNSVAIMQTRKRLKYRAGQGIVGRMTALFTSGVANSYQISGFGNEEDGFFIGYKDTQFGISYRNRGIREVQTLTITTASSTAENITVTLNGVAHSIAVTASANIQRTVYEISTGAYVGWRAEAIGATIVFISDTLGDKTGTFSITATTAVGSFSQTKQGADATESFIAQSSFNGDKLDGTGSSGFTIDPSKFNIFQIKIQYLGTGPIVFEIEHAPTNSNNPDWLVFHTIRLPNSLTNSSLRNPAFMFISKAYSTGSTTNLTIKHASFGLFLEGSKKQHGNRFSYFNQLTTVGATNYQALFSIRNTRFFNSISNHTVINLLSISGALKHTSPCTLYVFRDATLQGNPNFSQYSTDSTSYYDTAATTCTISGNDKLIWSGSFGDTGNLFFSFTDDITIQPGETITIAAKSSTGTPAFVTASLNVREDQ